MQGTKLVVGIVALVVIVSGAYVFSHTQSSHDTMTQPHTTEQKSDSIKQEGDPAREMTAQDKVADKAMMSSSTEGAKDSAMMKDAPANSETIMHNGQYIPFSPEKIALAAKGKVILFFHASWCPSCRAFDADIKAHLSDIPADVTVLDVDYDTAVALKQKYGVTYQHTFVQVSADGTMLAKWSGSPTLAEFLTHIK